MKPLRLWLLALLLLCQMARAQEPLVLLSLTVGNETREALVYAPASAKTTPAPLVFVFHGHGGTARFAERAFPIDRLWPEAISVYPQGLPTPGRLTDPEGVKAGWQMRGGSEPNRDLQFFDALLARLKQDYRVDASRIYSTGHSNGGGFTYLLWAERGNLFAAMAPSASVSGGNFTHLRPKPVLHIAGEKDPLVKFEWQQFTMRGLRELNGCAAEGRAWAKDCTLYDAPGGNPVITMIHAGGHVVPPEAPALVVRFFKEHPAP